MEREENGVKEFLDENKELLAAVGILGTIVGFATTLPNTWITYLLSFSLTSALALLWSGVKVWWKKNDSIQLEFLKLFLMLSFWIFILYILLSYRIMSWLFLFIPIMLALTYLVASTLRRSEKMVRFLQSDKPIKKITSFAIVILLVAVSFLLSVPLSMVFNVALDELDHTKTEIQLY